VRSQRNSRYQNLLTTATSTLFNCDYKVYFYGQMNSEDKMQNRQCNPFFRITCYAVKCRNAKPINELHLTWKQVHAWSRTTGWLGISTNWL